MENENLQALMQQAINGFQPQNAAGIDAQIQFHLSGEQGGDWVATIRDQQLVVEQGETPNPNLSIAAGTQDIFDMVAGRLNPMSAYMKGKVQVKGDMKLAMRLASVFKKP